MVDGANPETFSFFLKKVPFVKLTSAIDVNGSADLAKKFTLDNGLTVILHQDTSDPVVAVALTAHVGSAREIEGRTGFAHLFELLNCK